VVGHARAWSCASRAGAESAAALCRAGVCFGWFVFHGAARQEAQPVKYVSSCVHACTLLSVAISALQATLCISLLSFQRLHPWRFVARVVGTAIGPTAGDSLASVACAGGRLRTLVIRHGCFVRLALRRVRIKGLRQSPSGTIQRAVL
jgi:hypothetical protein